MMRSLKSLTSRIGSLTVLYGAIDERAVAVVVERIPLVGLVHRARGLVTVVMKHALLGMSDVMMRMF